MRQTKEPMDSPRYDIVMASYGQRELAGKCAGSVLRHSSKPFRLIWVENANERDGRDDDSSIYSQPGLWPMVIYLPWPENIGYTKAMNAGLALSTAPYIVLLNSDTEVSPLWLETLTAAFENPRIGAVGPATDRPSQWQGQVEKNRGVYVLPSPQLTSSGYYDVKLTFFCIMIRRQCFEDAGYLDDCFSPGLGEDDDWLYRAHLRGWKLAVQTDCLVKHVGSASWDPEERARIQQRNQEYLRKKQMALDRACGIR